MRSWKSERGVWLGEATPSTSYRDLDLDVSDGGSVKLKPLHDQDGRDGRRLCRQPKRGTPIMYGRRLRRRATRGAAVEP